MKHSCLALPWNIWQHSFSEDGTVTCTYNKLTFSNFCLKIANIKRCHTTGCVNVMFQRTSIGISDCGHSSGSGFIYLFLKIQLCSFTKHFLSSKRGLLAACTRLSRLENICTAFINVRMHNQITCIQSMCINKDNKEQSTCFYSILRFNRCRIFNVPYF